MAQTAARTATESKTRDAKGKPRRQESNRDLAEQIVVALILAFLIRGFEAEAFVIPTGSMAPTLMGRHKEITCKECGEVYSVNASDELDGRTSASRITSGTCGNCRYQADIRDAPSFKGDRILVMKFLYSLPFLSGDEPERWDVVVFKYPEEPEVNYIKRLVGLPNEVLRVYFGDVLTRSIGSNEPFTIARRPLEHQRAMQMLVYDDRHRPKAFDGMADWQRWKPREAKSWDEPTRGTFKPAAKSANWSNLRYRNLVPDPIQWKDVLAGRPTTKPRATLISDYYSYNSNLSGERQNPMQDWFQPHWVGDLSLSCKVQAASPSGMLRFELVEGGISNRCEVDLATGKATLFHGRDPLGEPAQTTLNDLKSHNVTFYNVDDRLTLEVDATAPFGDGLAYANPTDRHPAPTAADLDPVGIAAKGADVTVSDLVLKRDIYYTQNPGASDYAGIIPWVGGDDYDSRMVETFGLLSDPSRFADLGNLKERDFEIHPGHYMMMGDNSPRSKDGRQWDTTDQLRSDFPEYGWDPNRRESWEVPEALLIGKAFYVYWPHGKPFGPDIRFNQDFRVPFRPYIERMRWIR